MNNDNICMQLSSRVFESIILRALLKPGPEMLRPDGAFFEPYQQESNPPRAFLETYLRKLAQGELDEFQEFIRKSAETRIALKTYFKQRLQAKQDNQRPSAEQELMQLFGERLQELFTLIQKMTACYTMDVEGILESGLLERLNQILNDMISFGAVIDDVRRGVPDWVDRLFFLKEHAGYRSSWFIPISPQDVGAIFQQAIKQANQNSHQNSQPAIPTVVGDVFKVAWLPSNHPEACIEQGGRAIHATTEPGFLCFGPYKEGYPTIPLQAIFSILVDDNTDDRNIVMIDVYDQQTVLDKKTLTRKDFKRANEYYPFTLDFTPRSKEAKMEFRIYYMGDSYVCADKIAIIDPSEVSINPKDQPGKDCSSAYSPAEVWLGLDSSYYPPSYPPYYYPYYYYYR